MPRITLRIVDQEGSEEQIQVGRDLEFDNTGVVVDGENVVLIAVVNGEVKLYSAHGYEAVAVVVDADDEPTPTA